MVKVNCASIPHNLIESSLFGHEKGSFTGADSKKIGKFELAHGGTIFLDEIGEMPLDLQPKLLRVLQEGEIERIGNPQPIKVDVRVIAATNRNLERFSKEGKFRADLYYRLNVFPIYNIPLRDRAEDIPLLITHFLEKSNKKIGRNVRTLKNRDVAVLSKYGYPGNVRELENIIMRSVILSKGEEANLDFFYQSNTDQSNGESKPFFSFDELIMNHLKQALELADGKVTGDDSAAEMLGINGKTLASKLRKYGIDPRDFKN
jgi:transcriptional regulator with GAF, ATPase, and Fis domain